MSSTGRRAASPLRWVAPDFLAPENAINYESPRLNRSRLSEMLRQMEELIIASTGRVRRDAAVGRGPQRVVGRQGSGSVTSRKAADRRGLRASSSAAEPRCFLVQCSKKRTVLHPRKTGGVEIMLRSLRGRQYIDDMIGRWERCVASAVATTLICSSPARRRTPVRLTVNGCSSSVSRRAMARSRRSMQSGQATGAR